VTEKAEQNLKIPKGAQRPLGRVRVIEEASEGGGDTNSAECQQRYGTNAAEGKREVVGPIFNRPSCAISLCFNVKIRKYCRPFRASHPIEKILSNSQFAIRPCPLTARISSLRRKR
jgi:hypothetical protein